MCFITMLTCSFSIPGMNTLMFLIHKLWHLQ